MTPDIATVTDAIVQKLRASMTYLKTCEHFAGELDQLATSTPYEAPAALVIFDGMAPDAEEPVAFGSYHYTGQWSVILVARSVEGRTAAHTEATIGAFALIGDALACLAGTSDSGTTLKPNTINRVSVTATSAIYSIMFNGSVTV